MARVDLPASRVRARRRRRRIILISIAVVLVALVLGGLVWLSHAPFLRITTITVSGDQTLSDATVQAAVQSQISGSFWRLFAKSNIFLYPKTHIEEALPAAMPVIASAEVHAVNFHTIAVTVVERQPKALWCGESADASSSNCLLLDQSGVAYAPAPFSIAGSSGDYKRYYGALSGSQPQQYLTADQFSTLSALVDALVQNQFNNPIESVEVDPASDVRVTFAGNFVLLFTLSSAGADVYERFTLALGSDAFSGHALSDFEYLDLRFGDRLYYKVKDSETPVKSN